MLVPNDALQAALERAITDLGYTELPLRFVIAEWRQVVDAWNIGDLAGYADVPRIGRRNRLGSEQREALWPVFDATRQALASRGFLTTRSFLQKLKLNSKIVTTSRSATSSLMRPKIWALANCG